MTDSSAGRRRAVAQSRNFAATCTLFLLLLGVASTPNVGLRDPVFILPCSSSASRAGTARPQAPGRAPVAGPVRDSAKLGGGGAAVAASQTISISGMAPSDECPWMAPRKKGSLHPLFHGLVAEVFDRVIVLCYQSSCERHRPGGGAWPPAVQAKVVVQDGWDVDKSLFELYNRIHSGRARGRVKHSTKGFFSHMTAVKLAQKLKASTVLFLEADVEVSNSASKAFSSCPDIVDFVRTWRKAFSETPWQAVKLGASYLQTMKDERPGEATVCLCNCTVVPAWSQAANRSSITVCGTSRGKCRFNDSHAYALHKSAFPIVARALRKARQSLRPPKYTLPYTFQNEWRIDGWYALNLEWRHVLPMLAVQSDKREAWHDSDRFRRACVLGAPKSQPAGPPD